MPLSPNNRAERCDSSALLDTRYAVETPEGIDLQLYPAGVLPRALAYLIDLLIRAAIMLGAALILVFLGQFGIGLLMILYFLADWWYMVLFEVLNQGRTPGKKLLGLRTVHDDGTPVGWGASLTRNLLRFVDMLPFGYLLGLLSCLSHPAFKRLGDLAAGTLVIYDDQPLRHSSLPEGLTLRSPISFSLDEQRAVLAFAERHAELSAARRLEIAAILAPTLQVPAELAERQLHGIARTLVGET
jgi:uncharacterized RDD family membrane protein YckC